LHLLALQQLAQWMDVHLYVLNPCREFWFDLVDPARLSQLEAGGDDQGFEVGHSLLASWGRQTQSYLGLLTSVCDGEGASSADHYVDIEEPSLLAGVHRSILHLEEIAPGSAALADDDRSIEIHVCHSLTRELEVLHDHLLGLFAADPLLRASDILVVTPDLESAAPLIEAVFGTAPAQRRIPFAITGRARGKVNAPVRAFLELLGLASSRCPATAVFGLLQQPIVARRFGLDDEGLQRIHDWMLAAGIHWGLDAQHVASLDLPGDAAHTLAGGLDRLFLGYAAPGDLQEPFGDLLPSGDAEGSAALALGAFWRVVDGLQNLRVDLSQAREPQAWAGFLHDVADRFISPDDSEVEDHVELHAAFDELAQTMLRGGLDAPVAAPIVRAALQRVFDESAMGGVPTGRVTFTGMSSLRNVPFKVICAVGLNDGAFPTADRAPEFDLMAQAPRLGDRQRRTDQRTLFLDLMLAARQSLYFSYTGRSIRDNASLPPSVLVSELLDVIVPAVAAEKASQAELDRARQRLVVEHPLQPFSPEAFSAGGDERLRSFDAELAQALRSSLQIPEAKPSPQPAIRDENSVDIEEDASVDDEQSAADSRPFFTAALGEPGPEWREVTVERLVQFFRNPSRYLLRHRLQLDLPRDEETLDDDEPFLPDLPGRSALAARLLPALLRGADIVAVRRLAQCGGELPMGALGAADLERELSALTRFAEVVREASRGPVIPPHVAAAEFIIDGDAWRVTAGFADLRPAGLVRWRYDDERASDVLEAGIHHLVLCADPPKDLVEPTTTWLARSDQRVLPALARAEARERLGVLLQLYRRGLREPLPFFPKSAWTLLNSGEYRARTKWEGSPDFAGESQDPAYRLAFRGLGDPLGGDFEELANAVFGSLSGNEAKAGNEQAEG
jgi:exodeoxyribonuclease V gamma subunit